MTEQQILRRVQFMESRGCRVNEKRTEKKLLRLKFGSARQVRMHLKAARAARKSA